MTTNPKPGDKLMFTPDLAYIHDTMQVSARVLCVRVWVDGC